MNTLKKFFVALIILTLTITMVSAFPANAQTGTLGTEDPFLYCKFYDQNGDEVDGNALTSGEYTVNVNLSGMQNAAIMQFTAYYDCSSGSALKSLSLKSTYADENNTFELAAAQIDEDEQEVVVILNSLNLDTCSAISSEETTLATFDVEINCNGTVDFKNCFNFNKDPDLTFFMADYGDHPDCYALSEGTDIAYTVYLMDSDVTPDINNNEITISGTVYISQNETGSTGVFGARQINFKVNGEYVEDSNGDTAVTSSVSGHYGEFEISVPAGTTAITVTGASTIDRTVTLTGTQDISGVSIPIVYCDYNKDRLVNNTDYGVFNKNMNGTSYKYDFNNDGTVNNTDFGVFKRILNKGVSYSELSLDS